MDLTEEQEALIGLLKLSGADKDMIIGTILMLHKSQKATEDLLLWVYDRNPEKKELSPGELADIIRETIRIHDSLPKELQTAERLE